jgi:hypothetical protein
MKQYEKELFQIMKDKKAEIARIQREFRRELATTRMIIQNFRDILPRFAKISIPSIGTIKIKMPDHTTIPTFMKYAGKISKALGKDPYKSINKEIIEASWYIYISNKFGKDTDSTSINVELTTTNTEKCDMVEVIKTYTTYEATGYCKEIMNRRFVNN